MFPALVITLVTLPASLFLLWQSWQRSPALIWEALAMFVRNMHLTEPEPSMSNRQSDQKWWDDRVMKSVCVWCGGRDAEQKSQQRLWSFCMTALLLSSIKTPHTSLFLSHVQDKRRLHLQTVLLNANKSSV